MEVKLTEPHPCDERRWSPFRVGFWVLANEVPIPKSLVTEMLAEHRGVLMIDPMTHKQTLHGAEGSLREWLPAECFNQENQ